MDMLLIVILVLLFVYYNRILREKGWGGCLSFLLTLVLFLVILVWTCSRF